MHAQEVDLAHFDLILLDKNRNGYSSDGSYQLFLLVSHSDQPIRPETRRSQSPIQEFPRVVESIGTIIILHIIVGEQMIELNGAYLT